MKKTTQRYLDKKIKEAKLVADMIKDDNLIGVIRCSSRRSGERLFQALITRELNTEDIEYEEVKPK